ncbi:MAG: tetratricopeptide repeat protein, partial [Thermoplasmata archaeon]|nr:tetratricopeptide repeat protein [Thermoplasmata archaeon]
RISFEKAAEMEPEVKKYWNNLGWTAEKLENYEKAIEYFDKALQLEPEDMRIWYERGLCLKKLGRLEEALKSFEEALKLNPIFTKALFEKADILISLGNLNEALGALDLLLDKEPSNHRALYKRAWIRYQKKEYEAALKDIEYALKYEKREEYLELKKDICKAMKNFECVNSTSQEILSINRKNVNAWRDLARSYLEIGKVDSAVAKYKEALEILPDNKILLYELKDVLLENKRYADVIDVCKKILAIEPSDFMNIVDLSKALMKLKKYKEAKEYLTRALELNRNKDALELLGDVYFNLESFKNAIEAYSEALNLEPSDTLYYKLALSYHKIGKVSEALRYLKNALKMRKKAEYYLLGSDLYIERGSLTSALKYAKLGFQMKDSPEARMKLANILFGLKKYEDVISLLKPLAKSGDRDSLMLMARALEEDKRYEEAIALYREVIEKDKRNIDAWLGLGRCYLSVENYNKAAEAYERASLLSPEDKEIYRSLSFVYEKMNKLDDALKYVERGISLDPKDKYFWNSKALLLMKMKKYKEALDSFEHALELDPEFSPALEGKKDCERILEQQEVEKYAKSILIHEYRSGKKVTKKIAFQRLNVPLSYLNKVFAYIKREVPLNIETLSPEERKRLEKASLKLAKTLNKIENIKLSEIVANSELDISSAKLLLKYIEYCLSSDIQQEPDENIERLLKRALNMELKDYSVLNLMMNMDVGVCTARVLQKYLLEFLEEEEGSEGRGESENEERILAEGENDERGEEDVDEEEERFL